MLPLPSMLNHELMNIHIWNHLVSSFQNNTMECMAITFTSLPASATIPLLLELLLLPYPEIYLEEGRLTSTESSNSFSCLLWEPARQNYSAVVSAQTCMVGSGDKAVSRQ